MQHVVKCLAIIVGWVAFVLAVVLSPSSYSFGLMVVARALPRARDAANRLASARAWDRRTALVAC